MEEVKAFRKIHPHEFFCRFLDESVRPDGRGLSAVRKTLVKTGTIGSTDGSAMVSIGKTTVVCGIKLEVGKPTDTQPKEGRLEVDLTLSPLSSPKFTIGRKSEQCVKISEFLTNLIISTKVFSLTELCINEGECMWVAYADIMCLDYDGNLVDACLLALVSALKNCKSIMEM